MCPPALWLEPRGHSSDVLSVMLRRSLRKLVGMSTVDETPRGQHRAGQGLAAWRVWTGAGRAAGAAPSELGAVASQCDHAGRLIGHFKITSSRDSEDTVRVRGHRCAGDPDPLHTVYT